MIEEYRKTVLLCYSENRSDRSNLKFGLNKRLLAPLFSARNNKKYYSTLSRRTIHRLNTKYTVPLQKYLKFFNYASKKLQ